MLTNIKEYILPPIEEVSDNKYVYRTDPSRLITITSTIVIITSLYLGLKYLTY